MKVDWEGYRVAHRHTQHLYALAERAFNDRSRTLLTSAPSPRKWWATVKTAVFCASSSLPLLVNRGDRLMWS